MCVCVCVCEAIRSVVFKCVFLYKCVVGGWVGEWVEDMHGCPCCSTCNMHCNESQLSIQIWPLHKGFSDLAVCCVAPLEVKRFQ